MKKQPKYKLIKFAPRIAGIVYSRVPKEQLKEVCEKTERASLPFLQLIDFITKYSFN